MRDNKTNDASSHPLGTSAGAAGGAVAGATIGTMVGGPVGTAVGGAVGAAAGALAGQAAAAAVNPKDEHAYWRENYTKQTYVELSQPYSEFAPAYQYGWESHGRMTGRSFDQSEGELASGWNKAKGSSTLSWEKAKAATRDAWNRIELVLPGDADGDGR
jgi:hypothetical protein